MHYEHEVYAFHGSFQTFKRRKKMIRKMMTMTRLMTTWTKKTEILMEILKMLNPESVETTLIFRWVIGIVKSYLVMLFKEILILSAKHEHAK
jgi:hypothetical protein